MYAHCILWNITGLLAGKCNSYPNHNDVQQHGSCHLLSGILPRLAFCPDSKKINAITCQSHLMLRAKHQLYLFSLFYINDSFVLMLLELLTLCNAVKMLWCQMSTWYHNISAGDALIMQSTWNVYSVPIICCSMQEQYMMATDSALTESPEFCMSNIQYNKKIKG